MMNSKAIQHQEKRKHIHREETDRGVPHSCPFPVCAHCTGMHVCVPVFTHSCVHV